MHEYNVTFCTVKNYNYLLHSRFAEQTTFYLSIAVFNEVFLKIN